MNTCNYVACKCVQFLLKVYYSMYCTIRKPDTVSYTSMLNTRTLHRGMYTSRKGLYHSTEVYILWRDLHSFNYTTFLVCMDTRCHCF